MVFAELLCRSVQHVIHSFIHILINWPYEAAQSCMTFCEPMDCNLPGSSVHGILQARVLEWVATSFSRGSSQPRDQTRVSCIAGRCFTVWAIREAYLNQLIQQIFIKHLLWAWNSVGTEDTAVNKPKSPPSRDSHWNGWKRCIVKLLRRGAYLMAQTVKNPPAVQETWVWSLGWEDLLEEGMATHLENSMDRGAWWATV